jgi:hypothetical protein
VLRFRMFAVKNSHKRLAASARRRNTAGSLAFVTPIAASWRLEAGVSSSDIACCDLELRRIKKLRGVNLGEVVRRRSTRISRRLFLDFVRFVAFVLLHNRYLITSFMIRPWRLLSRRRYHENAGISRQLSTGGEAVPGRRLEGKCSRGVLFSWHCMMIAII